MSDYDFDLFVIGAGSGGVRAARFAAGFGARVGICEERYMGGTCVNVGCVPKKLFVYGSEFADAVRDAEGFGWSVAPPKHDWRAMVERKDAEIARLNGIYDGLLKRSGVRVLDGRGVLVDPHTVEVNGERHSARHILVATGGWPTVPSIPGAEHIITSNEAFYLEALPERIVIVGGGYIGVEFAGIFRNLGARVHLVHRRGNLLNEQVFDHDVCVALTDAVRGRGVDLHLGARALRVDVVEGGERRVTLDDDIIVCADVVMFATGRAPNTQDLGLEEVGVALNERGAIEVNDRFQSSVPSIYALGDVIDRVNLTPVATAQGMLLARALFTQTPPGAMDYENIPTAVFSQPPLGTVGLSESQARSMFDEVDVYEARFRPLKYTISGRDERTYMKLLVDRASDRVLGCHLIGPDAGEMIQGFAVALKCGATKAQFDATIGVHPTAAEEFVTMRTARREQSGEE